MLKLGTLVAYLTVDDTQMTKGMREAQGKLKAAGEKAKQYAPILGAAIAAGIGAGLVNGLDTKAAQAKLGAQIGDPAMAAKLGKAAGGAYGRGFGEDATEAMNTARAVMQAGLLPPNADAKTIEELTVKAQTLGTVWDQDVTQAARAASQMVKTGLAKNADEAFDILTRGFQLTGDQADDLLDTFSEYSTKFRDIGLSGPQAMGLLSQGLKAGARDADTVADALKEFSIRAIDGSTTTADGFKRLGLSGKKMAADIAAGGPKASAALDLTLDRLRAIKDPVERSAVAVELFGTKAEDLGQALFALDPSEAAKGLGDLEGATKKAGDALEQSGAQKLEAFKRQAQAALVEKLSAALPVIEKVVGWLKEHSAVVGPIVAVLGTLVAIIAVILGVYKAWIILQTALNIVMMLNPVGLVVLAIIALIAVFILLWNKSELFRGYWIWLWDIIKSTALAVGRWFRDTLWEKWIKGSWDAILNAGKKVWTWLSNLPGNLKKAFVKVADFITAPFKAAFNAVAGFWNRTAGKLSFTIPDWVPGIGGKGFSLPQIPLLARGGHIMRAGTAIVGDAGPELLDLPAGATVRPLSGGGGGGGGLVGGLLRIVGELRVRGSDLVLVLRDNVGARGGNVQAVIGSNT